METEMKPIIPIFRPNSSTDLIRKGYFLSFFDVAVSDYLSEKDAALSPLDEIEERSDNLECQPEEYNENVVIYSYRTENGEYDSTLDRCLKEGEAYKLE